MSAVREGISAEGPFTSSTVIAEGLNSSEITGETWERDKTIVRTRCFEI